MILFIVQRYADHRYLHSFPTRRSSDLIHVTQQINGLVELARKQNDYITINFLQWFLTGQLEEPLQKVDRDIRSEEHTSELQSPYDLVCRLLLEKKKR